jgi:hypothetical protein
VHLFADRDGLGPGDQILVAGMIFFGANCRDVGRSIGA